MDNVFSELMKLKGQVESKKGGGGKTDYLPSFKLEPGKVVKVRLVPLSFYSAPIIATSEHQNIIPDKKWKSFVCLYYTKKEPCPICEFAFGGYNKAVQDEDKNMQQYFYGMLPKEKGFAVVWNRNTNRLEKLTMSKKLMLELLNAIQESGSDPSDPRKGFDCKISSVQQEGFKKYSISLSDLSTPLAPTDEEIEYILEEVKKHKAEIEKWYTTLSREALQEIIATSQMDTDDDTFYSENEEGHVYSENDEEYLNKESAENPDTPAGEGDEEDAAVLATLNTVKSQAKKGVGQKMSE